MNTMGSTSNNISKTEEKIRTDDVKNLENATFAEMLLPETILQGLECAGFFKPSPIQLQAIPLGRCGLDLIVQAKSGTGKTCVFSVIALENIIVTCSAPQVLVLAPTREIAVQITQVMLTIGSTLQGLKCHSFIGGLPVYEDKEKLKNCHVVVGSPGRVKQLIEEDILKTDSIRLFVLDEADKLVEDGFQQNINYIYWKLPVNKQMLAVSATYPESLAVLLTQYMRDPTFVRLNSNDPALIGVHQFYEITPYHPVSNISFSNKVTRLMEIITCIPFNQCLVFTNYQTRAESVCEKLNAAGWPTSFIAGSQDQQDRLKAMFDLKQCQCRILVSTDLSARGIDAQCVNLVINLDVPWDAETYLHRVGRGGRFGTHALAITLATAGDEEMKLNNIQLSAHLTIKLLPDIKEVDLWKVELEVVSVQCEVFKPGTTGAGDLVGTITATSTPAGGQDESSSQRSDTLQQSVPEEGFIPQNSVVNETSGQTNTSIPECEVIESGGNRPRVPETEQPTVPECDLTRLPEVGMNGSSIPNSDHNISKPESPVNKEADLTLGNESRKRLPYNKLKTGSISPSPNPLPPRNIENNEIATDLKEAKSLVINVIVDNSSVESCRGDEENVTHEKPEPVGKPRRILTVNRSVKNKQRNERPNKANRKEVADSDLGDYTVLTRPPGLTSSCEKSDKHFPRTCDSNVDDQIANNHLFSASTNLHATVNSNKTDTKTVIDVCDLPTHVSDQNKHQQDKITDESDISRSFNKSTNSKYTKSGINSVRPSVSPREVTQPEEDCFGYNVLVRPPGLSSTLDANGYTKPEYRDTSSNSQPPIDNECFGQNVNSSQRSGIPDPPATNATRNFKPQQRNTQKSNFKKSEDSWAALFGDDEDELYVNPSTSISSINSQNPLKQQKKVPNKCNNGLVSQDGEQSVVDKLAAGDSVSTHEFSLKNRGQKEIPTTSNELSNLATQKKYGLNSSQFSLTGTEKSFRNASSSCEDQVTKNRSDTSRISSTTFSPSQTKSKEEAIERIQYTLQQMTSAEPKPWSYSEIKEAISKMKVADRSNQNKPNNLIENTAHKDGIAGIAKDILRSIARKGKEQQLASLIAELRYYSAQSDAQRRLKKQTETAENNGNDVNENTESHFPNVTNDNSVTVDNEGDATKRDLDSKDSKTENDEFLHRFGEENSSFKVNYNYQVSPRHPSHKVSSHLPLAGALNRETSPRENLRNPAPHWKDSKISAGDPEFEIRNSGNCPTKDQQIRFDSFSKFKQLPLNGNDSVQGASSPSRNDTVFTNGGFQVEFDRRTPSGTKDELGQSDAFCIVNRIAGKGSTLYDRRLQEGNGHATHKDEVAQLDYLSKFKSEGNFSRFQDRNGQTNKDKSSNCFRQSEVCYENPGIASSARHCEEARVNNDTRRFSNVGQEAPADMGSNTSQVWLAYYQQYSAYLDLCRSVVESSAANGADTWGWDSNPPVDPAWTQSYFSGVRSNADQLRYAEYMKQMNKYYSGNRW